MVEMWGVAVETASPSPSVQKLIISASILQFTPVDFRVLSRHFGVSGQWKREAITSSCRNHPGIIGLSNRISLPEVILELRVKLSVGNLPAPGHGTRRHGMIITE